MRYRDGTSETKTLWVNEILEWEEHHGLLVPRVGSAAWGDEAAPWAVFTVEEILYNAEATDYVRTRER